MDQFWESIQTLIRARKVRPVREIEDKEFRLFVQSLLQRFRKAFDILRPETGIVF
jgi:hypothetical protein